MCLRNGYLHRLPLVKSVTNNRISLQFFFNNWNFSRGVILGLLNLDFIELTFSISNGKRSREVEGPLDSSRNYFSLFFPVKYLFV